MDQEEHSIKYICHGYFRDTPTCNCESPNVRRHNSSLALPEGKGRSRTMSIAPMSSFLGTCGLVSPISLSWQVPELSLDHCFSVTVSAGLQLFFQIDSWPFWWWQSGPSVSLLGMGSPRSEKQKESFRQGVGFLSCHKLKVSLLFLFGIFVKLDLWQWLITKNNWTIKSSVSIVIYRLPNWQMCSERTNTANVRANYKMQYVPGRCLLSCCDWMFASPHNPHVEALISNAMVFGGGASGR